MRGFALLSLLALAVAAAPAQGTGTASFQGLGDLAGGDDESRAFGISADGSSVVGSSASAAGTEAFLWTQAGGLQGLGDLPGGTFHSLALAASADGSVVVGSSDSGFDAEAFRWTAATGLVGLNTADPFTDGFTIAAQGVSADGSLVVGLLFNFSQPGCFLGDGFTWTQAGGLVRTCGAVPGLFDYLSNRAVTPDGSTVVGGILPIGDFEIRVHRDWAPIPQGPPFFGNVAGEATGVSADGATVVGADGFGRALRWSASAGVQTGDLPGGGDHGIVWDVSADGERAVGSADTGAGCDALLAFDDEESGWPTAGCSAFLWDRELGARDLRDVLEQDYGLDLGGWTLAQATGVSGDGLVIVGFGTNPAGDTEAWRVTLPPACDDGLDNDGDGKLDATDPGCSGAADLSERGTGACDDGTDNDGDGKVDFRVGPGGDPGCRNPTWPTESPKCQNGIDDDGDTFIDFDGGAAAGVPPGQQTPPDPQCQGIAWRDREVPKGCGLGWELAVLLGALVQCTIWKACRT